ncbi:MAG TPA: hypothetical protein VMS92_21680 [Mycobacterium sp.]|nr:hypothetical protein [Mycobacterium sp.]
MSLQKPTQDAVKDPAKLYQLVSGFYESLVALGGEVAPVRAPKLKAITLPSFAEMRLRRGDTMGELGPRACVVTGKTTFRDGFEGVFGWDATSTLADDEANTIAVTGVVVGRWRRMSFASEEDVKAIASLHP